MTENNRIYPPWVAVKNFREPLTEGENYLAQFLDKNLPKDWKTQIEKILYKLKEINCSHNDIKPTDLLVLNGMIMLIDFQWAHKINKKTPGNWPKTIGGRYKHPQKFDDSYSIYKSIKSL